MFPVTYSPELLCPQQVSPRNQARSWRRHPRKSRKLGYLLAWALAYPAFGSEEPQLSDPTLDEATALFGEIPSVSGASRYEQPVTQAPASVSIVTADQIKKYGYRTLAAILSSLPGFLTTYDRAYHHVGVRGFAPPGDYNMRLLVLVDGHRINDNLEDYSAIGREFMLDPAIIERVEVVRGPASSLYGSNALFGVVNIITRRGRDYQGGQIAGAVSSFRTNEQQATYGRKFENGLEALVSLNRYDSKGHERLSFTDARGQPLGTANSLDGDYAERGFAKLSYEDFTLSGGFVTRKKYLPMGTTSTLYNDPRVFYDDTRAYADLNYRHRFTNGWDVTARMFWDHYGFRDSLPYAVGAGSVVNKDAWKGEWFGGEFLASYTLFDSHRVTLGTEYRRNYLQVLRNYDIDPYVQYANNRLTSNVVGVFVQDDWTILNNLRLNAGLRYDHYDSFGNTFNPRLGLIYDPWAGTTVKLLYGRAFRAPNVFESRYTCCNGSWVGNPNLQPETIETYELVLEQALGRHLRMRISPFYNHIDNIITLSTNAAGVKMYHNLGEAAEATGVEMELDGNYQGFEGRLSYSFQESHDDATRKRLVNSPQHMVKLNLLAPVWGEKTFAGVEVQYLSERQTVGGNQTGAFVISNLTLFTGELWKGLEITGSMYNVFNTKYRDPAAQPLSPDAIPQDGRALRLKISYDF